MKASFHMTALVVVGLVTVTALGACEPRSTVTVRVHGRDGAVSFELANAANEAQTLPLKELVVTEVGASQPHCRLTWNARSGPGLGSTWTYGQAHAEYTMIGCGPLAPGATYDVRAHLGPTQATTRFTVTADGAI